MLPKKYTNSMQTPMYLYRIAQFQLYKNKGFAWSLPEVELDFFWL